MRRKFTLPLTSANQSMQDGGNINKTGYLKGAATSKNDYNIIPSNHITTEGMAFPIVANGQILYPNTGDFIFNTSHVMEYPLRGKKRMQAGGIQKLPGASDPVNMKPLTSLDNQVQLRDLMTAALQSGVPLNQLDEQKGIRTNFLNSATGLYGDNIGRKLYSSVNSFNQNPQYKSLNPNQRATQYFEMMGTDPDIQNVRQQMSSFGTGVGASVLTSPIQQVQQQSVSGKSIASRRMGGRMQQGGINTMLALKGRNGGPDISFGVYDKQEQDNGQFTAKKALASTILPLNAILGKLAETNEWKQNEAYRLNYNNPLSTLGYNDNQSMGVKYGYKMGGKTKYCMRGGKYQEGGDTFEPDEFDYIEPPHQDDPVTDNQQLRENNDLSDDAEYQMAMDQVNADASIVQDVAPSSGSYSLRGNSESPLQGNSNSEKAFNYLLSKGIPDHAAAGIVGNLQVESGLNPKAYNPNDVGKPSFGIAQWRGDRLKAVKNWANQNGRDLNDLNTQLDYVLEEGTQRGDIQRTINTSSPEEAATIFGKKFERPASSEKAGLWSKRRRYASALLK